MVGFAKSFPGATHPLLTLGQDRGNTGEAGDRHALQGGTTGRALPTVWMPDSPAPHCMGPHCSYSSQGSFPADTSQLHSILPSHLPPPSSSDCKGPERGQARPGKRGGGLQKGAAPHCSRSLCVLQQVVAAERKQLFH